MSEKTFEVTMYASRDKPVAAKARYIVRAVNHSEAVLRGTASHEKKLLWPVNNLEVGETSTHMVMEGE